MLYAVFVLTLSEKDFGETKFEDYGGKYRPIYAVGKIKSETKSVFTNKSA